jgi:hypothetical protein
MAGKEMELDGDWEEERGIEGTGEVGGRRELHQSLSLSTTQSSSFSSPFLPGNAG